MTLRIHRNLLNQSLNYHEFIENDEWSTPSYKDPITIHNIRIEENLDADQASTSGNRVRIKAIAFAYLSDTTPFPEFKRRSQIVTQNKSYLIHNVVKVNEPFKNKLWSVELELI